MSTWFKSEMKNAGFNGFQIVMDYPGKKYFMSCDLDKRSSAMLVKIISNILRNNDDRDSDKIFDLMTNIVLMSSIGNEKRLVALKDKLEGIM